MSFSLTKLRSYLPATSNGSGSSNHSSKRHSTNSIAYDQAKSKNDSQRHSVSLTPEVGFQLSLESKTVTTTTGGASDGGQKTVPELNVHLIAARHLPGTFGMKTVRGYDIKVKLFPGSRRLESKILTNSWPKFNENFKFQLAPDIKPSMKTYTNEKYDNYDLPEKVFTGHFVVLTVYAHLELPQNNFNRINLTYRSLRDKGSSFIDKVVDSTANKSKVKPEEDELEPLPAMTKSEAKRNIGSVTCYLEPKIFKRNPRNDQFVSDEIWLPIKDITTTPSKELNNVMSAMKGQVEITLELSEKMSQPQTPSTARLDDNPFGDEPNPTTPTKIPVPFKRHFSFNEVKKKIQSVKGTKIETDVELKVTTSKLRCSIKVKDEIELVADIVYVKTAIYTKDVVANSWKCEYFTPTLSMRWDPEVATVALPLRSLDDLNDVLIRTTIATKTKMGKKIVLGTVLIGPSTSGGCLEQWTNAVGNKNLPFTTWHNFQ